MSGRILLLMSAGYGIWALAFVLLYSMLSVGCELGWHEVAIAGGVTLQRFQLVILFLLHAVAAAALTIGLRRHRGTSLLHSAAYLATLTALGATLFTFGTVFFLSPCH